MEACAAERHKHAHPVAPHANHVGITPCKQTDSTVSQAEKSEGANQSSASVHGTMGVRQFVRSNSMKMSAFS